jgi:hypothetical protein
MLEEGTELQAVKPQTKPVARDPRSRLEELIDGANFFMVWLSLCRLYLVLMD